MHSEPSIPRRQDIRNLTKDYIVENVDGVFVWLRFVRDELQLMNFVRKGSPPSTILGFLKSLPKGLKSYYERMLKGLNGGDEDDTRDGTRILQFCIFSHYPIELIELDHALTIPREIEGPPPEPLSWKLGGRQTLKVIDSQCWEFCGN
jgi:hypothetical protein